MDKPGDFFTEADDDGDVPGDFFTEVNDDTGSEVVLEEGWENRNKNNNF